MHGPYPIRRLPRLRVRGADPERVPRHAPGHARGRGALGDDRTDRPGAPLTVAPWWFPGPWTCPGAPGAVYAAAPCSRSRAKWTWWAPWRVHWPPVRVRCPVALSLSATFAHERPAARCSMMAACVSCSPWCHVPRSRARCYRGVDGFYSLAFLISGSSAAAVPGIGSCGVHSSFLFSHTDPSSHTSSRLLSLDVGMGMRSAVIGFRFFFASFIVPE